MSITLGTFFESSREWSLAAVPPNISDALLSLKTTILVYLDHTKGKD